MRKPKKAKPEASLKRIEKDKILAKNNFFMYCLLKLIRSYIQMCERCITPTYNHIFIVCTEKRLRNLASNHRFIRLGSYFANSASCGNGSTFNFLKIPIHLHYSLNHVCMHVVNSDESFRQIHYKLTVLTPAGTPAGKTSFCNY